MNNEVKDHEHNLLVLQAQELLVKQGRLPSGRKSRNDKGLARNKQTQAKYKQDQMWRYKVVLSKLLNKATKLDDSMLILTDVNGYYVDIAEKLKPIYGEFKQSTKGKTKYRQVKYVRVQKPIQLEKYRFNGWQEMATNNSTKNIPVPLPNNDLTRWALDCAQMSPKESLIFFVKKAYTWQQLFLAFYHIQVDQINEWDYATWREHYECVPGVELDDDFKFNINVKPGTPEFMSEWSWYAKERIEIKEDEERKQKEKNSWTSKVSSKFRQIKGEDDMLKDYENDYTIKEFTQLNENGTKLLLKKVRQPHPNDKPVVVNNTNDIVEPPQYFGEWVDITEAAQIEFAEKHKRQIKERQKKDELTKAKELLVKLMNKE